MDGNKIISGNDALTVINEINAFGIRKLPTTATADDDYLDVTGDGRVQGNDALAVINHINAFGIGPAGEAAGEGARAEISISWAASPSLPLAAQAPPIRTLDELFAQWAEGEFDWSTARRKKA